MAIEREVMIISIPIRFKAELKELHEEHVRKGGEENFSLFVRTLLRYGIALKKTKEAKETIEKQSATLQG